MAGATLLRHLGPRLFAAEPVYSGLAASARGVMPAAARIFPARMASTSSAGADVKEGAAEKLPEPAATAAAAATDPQNKKAVVSYWGIQPPKLVKEDGTEWKWLSFRVSAHQPLMCALLFLFFCTVNSRFDRVHDVCFFCIVTQPWDTYTSDTSIDVTKHHEPKGLPDKLAYWTVRSLAVPRDLFFQRRHASHALLLETVAGVPGMVGGMLLHLRSLRRFEQSGGWIRALLEEAENERMHLMTFLEVMQPRWWERALVLAAQGVFFNAYFVGYLVSPKFAHRFVGYLEEEAVSSYTEYLKDLEAGKIENTPAPAIAIDYWRLPADATLKDVVTVIRADEAHHRDLNHFASVRICQPENNQSRLLNFCVNGFELTDRVSRVGTSLVQDIQQQGMKLKDTPAPIGYH
jgi:ubiquinol oxidase